MQIGVDGALLPEFERYINSVTVTLRKQHQNGEETLRELVLDRAAVQADAGRPAAKVVYGWNGDEDRAAWLQYDYRTRWSFKGGGIVSRPTGRARDAPMIDLFAPYERRVVQIVGNRAVLKQRGVRAVVVGDRATRSSASAAPPAGGRARRTDPAEPSEPRIEITLPLGSSRIRLRRSPGSSRAAAALTSEGHGRERHRLHRRAARV